VRGGGVKANEEKTMTTYAIRNKKTKRYYNGLHTGNGADSWKIFPFQRTGILGYAKDTCNWLIEEGFDCEVVPVER
jgi:hypothetical protein